PSHRHEPRPRRPAPTGRAHREPRSGRQVVPALLGGPRRAPGGPRVTRAAPRVGARSGSRTGSRSGSRQLRRLLHSALGPATGAPLRAAALGDRERVALLLQGAALLSHLRRAGWRLTSELAAGWVRDGELLCGVGAKPGVTREWGTPLRGLLATLFAEG